MTETQIQIAVIQNIQARGVAGMIYWHTPNGGKRAPRQAKTFQRMGVMPGVSDLVLHHGGEAFALELKAPKEKLTADQAEFLENWRSQGPRYHGSWADNLDDALAILKSWGLLK